MNGAVVWSATYTSFGEATVETDTITNNLRFPGQYYDEETGLHYNYHRYYDSGTGRYLRVDPLLNRGGETHAYIYSRNNPVILFDKNGLACGSGWTDKIVPDSPYGYDFTKACEWHDSCYATPGNSKSYCDFVFYEKMLDVCNKYPFSRDPHAKRWGCRNTASTYYIAVFWLGHIPYKRAQCDPNSF